MATIYVVTAGEYSDYHIVAATTSKEHAEKIKNACNKNEGWEMADIEKYEDSQEYKIPLWYVGFDRSGNAYWVEEQYSTAKETVLVKKENDFPCGISVVVYVRAKDKETAIKAAAERRAKALAEKESL